MSKLLEEDDINIAKFNGLLFNLINEFIIFVSQKDYAKDFISNIHNANQQIQLDFNLNLKNKKMPLSYLELTLNKINDDLIRLFMLIIPNEKDRKSFFGRLKNLEACIQTLFAYLSDITLKNEVNVPSSKSKKKQKSTLLVMRDAELDLFQKTLLDNMPHSISDEIKIVILPIILSFLEGKGIRKKNLDIILKFFKKVIEGCFKQTTTLHIFTSYSFDYKNFYEILFFINDRLGMGSTNKKLFTELSHAIRIATSQNINPLELDLAIKFAVACYNNLQIKTNDKKLFINTFIEHLNKCILSASYFSFFKSSHNIKFDALLNFLPELNAILKLEEQNLPFLHSRTAN